MNLASGQIKQLRVAANRFKLKPVVIIGQNGLSQNLNHEIDAALNHHELIKLRIPALAKIEKRKLGRLICAQHRASLISSVGHVIVIYRRNPETDRFAPMLAS